MHVSKRAALLAGAAVAATVLGGVGAASAASTPSTSVRTISPAAVTPTGSAAETTTGPDTDNVQQGDQTGPDTGTTG